MRLSPVCIPSALLALAAAVPAAAARPLYAVYNDQPIEMSEVNVTDRRLRSPEEPAPFKLPLTLHEIPRSVSVIDAQRIREQGFRTPVDTLYYTPGVFPNSTAGGAYHYIARGFRMSPNETLVDGFQGFYVGGGQSTLSLYGIERVVTLRGPAGLLYGAATLPGGLMNLVTKKPSERPFTRIDLTTSTYAGSGVGFGDRSTFGLEFDSTGPIAANRRVLYRTIIAGDDSDHYTADALNQTRYLSAALTFLLDEEGRTSLTPLVQWSRNRRPAGAALVASPTTSLSTADGRSGPIDESTLSPFDVNLSAGGRVDEILIVGFDLRSTLSEAATVNAGYRYNDYATDINQWTASAPSLTQADPSDPRSWTIARTQSKSRADRSSHNFDVNGTYEFEPAASWRNRLQAGVNGRAYDSETQSATGANAPQSPINLYTGATASPLADVLTTWLPPSRSEEFHWNAYLQNQAELADGEWVLTAGLGYGQQHYEEAPTRKGDLTPNAGLVWNLTPDLALYASYSTSYQPADPTLENAAGESGTFDPQTGTNYEVGLKYDVLDQRLSFAASLFETERDRVLVQSDPTDLNPNGNRYYTQQSGQRARGLEASGTWRPLPAWRFDATFAYLDASYRTGPFPEPVAKTPEYSWSLYSRYDFREGPLQRLGVTLGLVWQDERLGGNAARSATSPDPLMLPSFTRVDLGLHYPLNDRVDLALNVNNVLDERIFVDGTTGANLQLAAPRTVSLRVGYTF